MPFEWRSVHDGTRYNLDSHADDAATVCVLDLWAGAGDVAEHQPLAVAYPGLSSMDIRNQHLAPFRQSARRADGRRDMIGSPDNNA